MMFSSDTVNTEGKQHHCKSVDDMIECGHSSRMALLPTKQENQCLPYKYRSQCKYVFVRIGLLYSPIR
jgi:hypothetical protein